MQALGAVSFLVVVPMISRSAHSGLWIASVHTMRTLLPSSLGPVALFGVFAAVGAVGSGVGWLALPRRGERAPVETPTARGADHEPAR